MTNCTFDARALPERRLLAEPLHQRCSGRQPRHGGGFCSARWQKNTVQVAGCKRNMQLLKALCYLLVDEFPFVKNCLFFGGVGAFLGKRISTPVIFLPQLSTDQLSRYFACTHVSNMSLTVSRTRILKFLLSFHSPC